jgi:Zinc knuckle
MHADGDSHDADGNGNGSGRGRRGKRYAKVKCWNCGVMGHIARDCDYGQAGKDDEKATKEAVAHAAEVCDNLACC